MKKPFQVGDRFRIIATPQQLVEIYIPLPDAELLAGSIVTAGYIFRDSICATEGWSFANKHLRKLRSRKPKSKS